MIKTVEEPISEGKIVEAERTVEYGLLLAYREIESSAGPGPAESGSGSNG